MSRADVADALGQIQSGLSALAALKLDELDAADLEQLAKACGATVAVASALHQKCIRARHEREAKEGAAGCAL